MIHFYDVITRLNSVKLESKYCLSVFNILMYFHNLYPGKGSSLENEIKVVLL